MTTHILLLTSYFIHISTHMSTHMTTHIGTCIIMQVIVNHNILCVQVMICSEGPGCVHTIRCPAYQCKAKVPPSWLPILLADIPFETSSSSTTGPVPEIITTTTIDQSTNNSTTTTTSTTNTSLSAAAVPVVVKPVVTVFEQFSTYVMRHFVEASKNMKWCPSPGLF